MKSPKILLPLLMSLESCNSLQGSVGCSTALDTNS